jgi:thiol:disulfide interchange protein DsbD
VSGLIGFRRFTLVLATGLGLAGACFGQARLLPPDQAFHVAARQTGAQTVELVYSMEPGYYLYKDRFSFKTDSAKVRVVAIDMAPPKRKHDLALDKVVEYFDETVTVKLNLQVPVSASKTSFQLVTVAQGCAQVGVCYPPISRNFVVEGNRP